MPHAPIPGLHQSVVECFIGQLPVLEEGEFTQGLEGRVPYPYLDILGLVTTGVGNLADPVDACVRIKGWTIDGRPATDREVRDAWLALKGEDERRIREGERPLRKMHHKFAAPYTRIRLSESAIDALVHSKLASNVRHMVAKHFPQLPSWPADAQLAACSMAWAVGPGFPVKFENFTKAASAQNWTACVASCKIREEGNPGVVPRNARNRHCLMNAAFVQSLGMPVDVLHWPGDAPEWPAHATSTPEEITRVSVPHPGPAPQKLADPFFVSDALKREPGR